MADSKVILRYLGTSDVFVDSITNTQWLKEGPAHELGEEDAKRVMATSRYDLWENVTAVQHKAELDAAAAREREAAALAARAAKKPTADDAPKGE